MDRIININVGGNYISKDNKNAGVRGEANVTKLRIIFDEGWDGYAKKVTFWNALGTNPVEITLTTNLRENNDNRVYLVPIPAEPLEEEGELEFVIDGYADGQRQRSVSGKLEVNDAPMTDDAGEPTDPTPTQAEQLQLQIETIISDIQTAVEAKNSAILANESAIEAKEIAIIAKSEADSASNNAKSAYQGAVIAEEGAMTARDEAVSASESAENAKEVAISAKEDIENMTVSSEGLSASEQPTVTKTEQGGVVNLHFGIPEGEKGNPFTYDDFTSEQLEGLKVKGDTGNSGVYIGDEEPSDPDIRVWIDPNGEKSDLKGESAYDVAVKNGFKGTEQEWLQSLKGDNYILTSADKAEIAETVKNEYFTVEEKSATLTSSEWLGSSAPYTQIIAVSGITASSAGTVFVSENATDEQFNAAVYATLRKTAQETNSITVKAYGVKPTVDIPLTIRIGG